MISLEILKPVQGGAVLAFGTYVLAGSANHGRERLDSQRE